jgi:C-methyltransferase
MDLLQIACAPFLTGALTAAATAGVADLLHDGPLSTQELAAATNLQASVLQRILQLLSAVNIFERHGDDRWGNNEASEPLRTGHEASVRYFCMLAGREYARSFTEIMHTAHTGESAFRHVYGSSIYSYMDADRTAGEIYDRAMEDLARPVGALLSKQYDFTGASTLVDVGGGNGTLLKGILRSVPAIRGVCLDRKDVCDRARGRMAKIVEGDLAERLSFTEGDFFVSVPAGADVYLLKNVLHNWADGSSMKILSSIRSAMRPESRLLVLEPLMQKDSQDVARLIDDLFQIVVCEEGTTARTHQQMETLLRYAGLEVVQTLQLPTGHAAMVSRVQAGMVGSVRSSHSVVSIDDLATTGR